MTNFHMTYNQLSTKLA